METQSKTAGVQLKQTFISPRESQWTHRSLTVTSARFLHLQAREGNCIQVKQNCRPDRSGLGLFGVFPLVKLRLWTFGFRFSFRRRVLIRELSVEFSSDGFYEANICSVSKTWFSDQLQTEPGVHCLQEQSPLHPLCYILFAPPLSLHPLYSTLSKKPALSLYPVLSSVLERLLKKVVLTSTDTDGGISCFCPIQTLKPRSGKWKGVCVCNTHTEGKRRCVSAPPPSLLLPLLSFTSEQQSSP